MRGLYAKDTEMEKWKVLVGSKDEVTTEGVKSVRKERRTDEKVSVTHISQKYLQFHLKYQICVISESVPLSHGSTLSFPKR